MLALFSISISTVLCWPGGNKKEEKNVNLMRLHEYFECCKENLMFKPSRAAQCRGVRPSLSVRLTSAPCSMSNFTFAIRPNGENCTLEFYIHFEIISTIIALL